MADACCLQKWNAREIADSQEEDGDESQSQYPTQSSASSLPAIGVGPVTRSMTAEQRQKEEARARSQADDEGTGPVIPRIRLIADFLASYEGRQTSVGLGATSEEEAEESQPSRGDVGDSQGVGALATITEDEEDGTNVLMSGALLPSSSPGPSYIAGQTE